MEWLEGKEEGSCERTRRGREGIKIGFMLIFFLFLVLRIEPRVLCMLSKCSTMEINPQSSIIT
jgi:hypothetical protein